MSDNQQQHNVPLCVDLDGTLLATDSLWEDLVGLVFQNPFILFAVLLWIARGKPTLKLEVAKRANHDPALWPYRPEVLDFLKAEKIKGRQIFLATGAAEQVALAVARHLTIFDDVFHSTADVNLTSVRKRALLVEKFGTGGFDYMGDSRADIAVFEVARQSIVVAPDRAARDWSTQQGIGLLVDRKNGIRVLLKAMRVHQWLKNTLLAVPLILDHAFFELDALFIVMLAFLSFSFAASFVYVINDLADLSNDRLHLRKRTRPLAAGDLSIPAGVALAFILLVGSLIICAFLPIEFLGILLLYVVTTTIYSVLLKKKLLVDVFTLAGLFTLRILAGTVAIGTDVSFWLLGFSIFFFLSLALVKRYVELQDHAQEAGSTKLGRGYYAVDAELIIQAGIASAFSAALVLALYLQSDEIQQMYQTPFMLWPLCPMILYMLLRIWVLARRGQMLDDPVVFIIGDWRSQLITAVGAVLVLLGALQ